MIVFSKLANSTNTLNTNPESETFTRKRYHKNEKKQQTIPDTKPELPPFQLPQFPQLDPNPSQSCRNRSILDHRIASLIELGLKPELSPQKKTKIKLIRKHTIMITDFMKKSAQNKILSFHNLKDLKPEETDSICKEKVPKSYTFIRSGSMSLRNSQSSQVLPPIFREGEKLKDNFKVTRDHKLKKIDEIMDSCTQLLKNNKVRLCPFAKVSERVSL